MHLNINKLLKSVTPITVILLISFLTLLSVGIYSFVSWQPKECPSGALGDGVLLKPSQHNWSHPIWGPLPPDILRHGSIGLWVFADDSFLNTRVVPLAGFSGQFRFSENPPTPKEPMENDIMTLYKTGLNINFSFRSAWGSDNFVMPTWFFSVPWEKNKWNYLVVNWKEGERPNFYHDGKKIPYTGMESATVGRPVQFDSGIPDLRLDIGGYRKTESYLPPKGIFFDEINLYYKTVSLNEVSNWFKNPILGRNLSDWAAGFEGSERVDKFQIDYRTQLGAERVRGNMLGDIYLDEKDIFENTPIHKCNWIEYLGTEYALSLTKNEVPTSSTTVSSVMDTSVVQPNSKEPSPSQSSGKKPYGAIYYSESSSPISWDEGQFHFSLVRAGLGLFPTSVSYPYGTIVDNKGVPYPNGAVPYGISLTFKVSSNSTTSQSEIPFNLQRLIDEEGSFVSQNTKKFSSGGEVVFIIPEDKIISWDTGEYTFTTGGKSNIFFYLKPKAYGVLDISIEPSSG